MVVLGLLDAALNGASMINFLVSDCAVLTSARWIDLRLVPMLAGCCIINQRFWARRTPGFGSREPELMRE
ncbi:MAG: hypothetical protein A2139_11010 [Desulfobacca sp. RBG_16_60_12]|nr:MAG: hypothetical protein A2139_11010 [Desulfobacca sp. RBG_16_60_12]